MQDGDVFGSLGQPSGESTEPGFKLAWFQRKSIEQVASSDSPENERRLLHELASGLGGLEGDGGVVESEQDGRRFSLFVRVHVRVHVRVRVWWFKAEGRLKVEGWVGSGLSTQPQPHKPIGISSTTPTTTPTTPTTPLEYSFSPQTLHFTVAI